MPKKLLLAPPDFQTFGHVPSIILVIPAALHRLYNSQKYSVQLGTAMNI